MNFGLRVLKSGRRLWLPTPMKPAVPPFPVVMGDADKRRFWGRVSKGAPDACWLWTAGKDKDGYGRFAVVVSRPGEPYKQKHLRANRVAWELANGRPLDDALTLHSCDNPSCVNPKHLRPGTQADNRKDCGDKGRNAVGARSGSHTHPERRRRGENHGLATLTEEKVVRIRTLNAHGVSGWRTAEIVGATRSQVHQVLSGKTWTHVKAGQVVNLPYRVLLVDPPWPFGDKLPGNGRGAEKHYRLMSMEELYAYIDQLPELGPDCVMFLWRVASMQQEALNLAKAWGFVVKTEIVWRKTTKNGKRAFGMGRITRAEHETCLVCVRGRPKVLRRDVRSCFDTEEPEGLFEARVGQHSAKPEAIYEIIESLFPGPYLSVFDRRQRRGWRCIGDEVAAGVPYADR